MYKLAIFDMDGTILNTLEDLADSTNVTLEQLGYAKRTVDEVRAFVGNGIRRLMEQALPEGSLKEEIDLAVEIFNKHYKDHSADKTCPYDGVIDAITELRRLGVKTAVVSNKPDYAVQDLCKEYFKGCFDYAVGEKEGIRRKPYPDSVELVLQHFDMKKEDAVYIGDSDVDLKTSQNAQMDVIMVGWGFREEALLLQLGAPFVIHHTTEIVTKVMEGRKDTN